jgi:hypothetical protein
MPRWNFSTATLGDGISTSTGTSRRVTQGMMTLRQIVSVDAHAAEEGEDPQDGHENGEPEFLCAEKSIGVGSPSSTCAVIRVSQNDKHPRRGQPQPADETMVSFERVVMVTVIEMLVAPHHFQAARQPRKSLTCEPKGKHSELR